MKTKGIKGITIISLTITIIILLILSGVSISTISGENGILTKTRLAKQMSEVSSEKEAIQLDVMLANMENKFDNSNKYYIGEPLYDKTIENGDKWNIVIDNKNLKQYGTGYSYIEQGTEINNYGKTQYRWLVNYESGEIIQLNDEYTTLSYKSTLAVTDGLVFNMDAINVNENQSNWGENVSLYYYDTANYDTTEKRRKAYAEQNKYENVTQFDGYDRLKSSNSSNYIDSINKTFRFNGNNYIEIYSKSGFDFSKGLTIEFFGNIDKQINGATSSSIPFIGLLGLWSGEFNNQCKMRFGNAENRYILYSLNDGGEENKGSWSKDNSAPWLQYYETDFMNKDRYITIEFEPIENEKTIQRIYMDGKMVAEGWLEECYWNSFINLANNLNYIELGRVTMASTSNWCYMKGMCYATRIYNRSLNSEEILSNCNKTKLYRSTIDK